MHKKYRRRYCDCSAVCDRHGCLYFNYRKARRQAERQADHDFMLDVDEKVARLEQARKDELEQEIVYQLHKATMHDVHYDALDTILNSASENLQLFPSPYVKEDRTSEGENIYYFYENLNHLYPDRLPPFRSPHSFPFEYPLLPLSKVNYLRTVLRIRSAESTSLCDDRIGLKTNKIPGHHHTCLPSEPATTIRTRTLVNYSQSSPTRVDQSPAGSENCALASDPE